MFKYLPVTDMFFKHSLHSSNCKKMKTEQDLKRGKILLNLIFNIYFPKCTGKKLKLHKKNSKDMV